MRQKLLSYAILSIILIPFALSKPAFASGITLHIWKADLAAQMVADQELKDLMERRKAAYQNGAVFPDSGYTINHPYGEYSHWDGFLNSYYQVIRKRCPTLVNAECEELFAHFLGSLAHTIGDINFDRHFVTSAAQIDYGGDIDIAQKWIDTGIDFLAIFEYQRAFQVPRFTLPIQALLEVYQVDSVVDVSKLDLLKGTSIVKLGLIFEPVGASFTYFYYKHNMPWASQNYFHARGGVKDTAERIAIAWQLVWDAYQRQDSGPLFYNHGGWPYSNFYVNDFWLEDFSEHKYKLAHQP